MNATVLIMLAQQKKQELLRESKRESLKKQAEADKKQHTQTLRENVTKADLETAQLMN